MKSSLSCYTYDGKVCGTAGEIGWRVCIAILKLSVTLHLFAVQCGEREKGRQGEKTEEIDLDILLIVSPTLSCPSEVHIRFCVHSIFTCRTNTFGPSSITWCSNGMKILISHEWMILTQRFCICFLFCMKLDQLSNETINVSRRRLPKFYITYHQTLWVKLTKCCLFYRWRWVSSRPVNISFSTFYETDNVVGNWSSVCLSKLTRAKFTFTRKCTGFDDS